MRTDGPVSVVGDVNGWDPLMHPLRKRANGTRSVTMELPTNAGYPFTCLAAGGTWFCDPHAEACANEYAEPDSVLRT